MRRAAGWAAFVAVLGVTADSRAQERAQDRWNAPFGGTWSAKFTAMSEYSYRGMSLSERQPAVQATVGYDLPIVQDRVHFYLEAWGGNVRFAPEVATEITASASLVFHALDGKLSVWLTLSRFNYPEAPPELGYSYNEASLWAGYDFGTFQVAGNLGFSPNYYGNAGASLYKEVELTVPLSFVRLDGMGFSAVGSVGNLQVEHYLNSGLPRDNYWYWEVGLKARVFQVDMALSYVGTNLDVAGCDNSRNCEGRVVFKMSKTF